MTALADQPGMASFRVLTVPEPGRVIEYTGQGDRWELDITVERPGQDDSPYTATLTLRCDPATGNKVQRHQLEAG